MGRLGAVGFLAWMVAGCLCAQTAPVIDRLSTNHGGTQLYFRTSLTLRDERPQNAFKIVRAADGQWNTVLRDLTDSAEAPDLKTITEYQSFQVNSTGFVQVFTSTSACPPGIFCPPGVVDSAFLRVPASSPGAVRLGYGRGGVSDNGQWVMASSDFPADGPPVTTRVRSSGTSPPARESVTGYFRMTQRPVRRVIANNGTIASAFGIEYHVWRPGSPNQELRFLARGISTFVLDPEAEFVLGAGGDSLYAVYLDSAEMVRLVQAQEGIAMPDLAADRHTTVFLSAANWEAKNNERKVQVWLCDLWTGRLTQLTEEATNVTEVVLSGDGRVAYAVTDDLRMLRIDVTNQRTEGMTPPFPFPLAADPTSRDWAPGGRYWFWGRGFDLVEPVVGEAPATLLSHSPYDAEFLVPPNVSLGSSFARLGAHGSPFQPFGYSIRLFTAAPSFLGSGGRGFTWYHDDTGMPVTDQNPASLGERLLVRMTGMGPVDGNGVTTTSFEWYTRSLRSQAIGGGVEVTTPIEVLDSKRSAEEEGVYAVKLRLPEQVASGIWGGVLVRTPANGLRAISPLPLQQ